MGKFVDEVGAIRHAMSDKELNELYKRLENFIADCTVEEAKESRDAFVKVQTMIYQRMRETKNNINRRGKPRHKPRVKMIVKKLELVNFQVIKEFNADFDGNVYFITGDNELGKSTVLKAIGALLTGNRDAVLKNGESKGFAK